ncbi:hypothetical protein B0T11DRAFT_353822, partial [Plectosphaerella cucumerina]
MANHSENTKKMTRPEEKLWNKYVSRPALLEFAKLDPRESLESCKASIFKCYLHWRVSNSKIKKESSIFTYWNVLSMVYAQRTNCYMDGKVLYDIGNFGLDTSKKEKSGLYVEDLDLILHHHYILDSEIYAHERLRVQLALILIIAGATATRPDALIGRVLYKHIEFQLFPPAAEGERPRLGLVWNLEHIKRSAGVSEKKTFGFHEEDTPFHDPVLHTLALAFADDAFLNDFSGPGQIYDLVVPAQSDRLRLMWKTEWAERPIFRNTEGFQVALEEALTYSKTRGHLIRLGRALGYAKKLEFYDLRRGSGKKLNEALTPEERNKAMGHRQGDSSTYVRYYMSNFVGQDTQSIVFGSDLQTDLIQLMGRLRRHGDAPTSLTPEQKSSVQKNPQLIRYLQKRSRAMERFRKQGFRSYEAAKDTTAGKEYEESRKKAASLRKTLSARMLEQAIREFHDTIHAEEIERQLLGIKPDAESLAPSSIKYELREREEVARLFSQATEVKQQEDLNQLRLKLVVALSQLCKRRESPCRRQARSRPAKTVGLAAKKAAESTHGPLSQLQSDTVENTPREPPGSAASHHTSSSLICPFCKWADMEVGSTQREKTWRID